MIVDDIIALTGRVSAVATCKLAPCAKFIKVGFVVNEGRKREIVVALWKVVRKSLSRLLLKLIKVLVLNVSTALITELKERSALVVLVFIVPQLRPSYLGTIVNSVRLRLRLRLHLYTLIISVSQWIITLIVRFTIIITITWLQPCVFFIIGSDCAADNR